MENNNDPRRFLYGWVTQWNPFRGKYECTNRDNYFKLFNGGDRTPILESVSRSKIEAIIIECEGRRDRVIKFKEGLKDGID
jgi:hypothetical protein